MSNAMTNAQNNGVAVGHDPFAAAGAGAGNNIYVKFIGASGHYVAGQDQDELANDIKLAADMQGIKWIWTFWDDGDVLETTETLLIDDPNGFGHEPDHVPTEYTGDMTIEEIRSAQKNDRDFKDGWGVQGNVIMREVGGNGDEYVFRFGKGVALNGFRSLINSYGRQYRFKQGKLPIVELDANKFKVKAAGVGWRYAPVLKITDWKSEEELMASAGEDPGDYDDGGASDAPQIEKASEDQDEAPVRRGAGRGRGRNV